MLPAGVVSGIDHENRRVDRRPDTEDQIKNAPDYDESMRDDTTYRRRLSDVLRRRWRRGLAVTTSPIRPGLGSQPGPFLVDVRRAGASWDQHGPFLGGDRFVAAQSGDDEAHEAAIGREPDGRMASPFRSRPQQSPGRTGISQRSLSTPTPITSPLENSGERTIRPIVADSVCHPDAVISPKKPGRGVLRRDALVADRTRSRSH